MPFKVPLLFFFGTFLKQRNKMRLRSSQKYDKRHRVQELQFFQHQFQVTGHFGAKPGGLFGWFFGEDVFLGKKKHNTIFEKTMPKQKKMVFGKGNSLALSIMIFFVVSCLYGCQQVVLPPKWMVYKGKAY